MAARSGDQEWLRQTRKGWLVLAQGALWLGGILGGFLLPPPVGILASEEKLWLRLGQFIIAVVLGLVFFASRRWRQTRHALAWAGAASLFLALAVAVFFRYQQLTLAWTVNYVGQKVVVGSVLTPVGQADTQKNPGISNEDLVMDFAGRTAQIWTADSIDHRRLILAACYVSCLPLFTVCLITVVQAVACGAPAFPRSKAQATPPTSERRRTKKVNRKGSSNWG
jgi:hypothetical protein